MALVPVIQPPIIRALTTKEERAIKMEQLRPVSKTEKIVFPIVAMIIVMIRLNFSWIIWQNIGKSCNIRITCL